MTASIGVWCCCWDAVVVAGLFHCSYFQALIIYSICFHPIHTDARTVCKLAGPLCIQPHRGRLSCVCGANYRKPTDIRANIMNRDERNFHIHSIQLQSVQRVGRRIRAQHMPNNSNELQNGDRLQRTKRQKASPNCLNHIQCTKTTHHISPVFSIFLPDHSRHLLPEYILFDIKHA